MRKGKKMPSDILYFPAHLADQSGYWYLATPYAKWPAGKDDAAAHAAALAGRLAVKGVHVFSPIAHWHYVKQYAPTLDKLKHDDWMAIDKTFLEAAHGLVVASLYGWETSAGVQQEIAWAKEWRKPRYLLDPMDLSMRKL